MTLWIIFTLLAVLSQSTRFALQKGLTSAGLSAVGATYARFLFAAPLASFALFVLLQMRSTPFPALPVAFWPYAVSGSIAQILATVCVVSLFQLRHFAVGITLKKTEVVMSAIIGFIILGDQISFWGGAAVAVGFLGVLVLSEITTTGELHRSPRAMFLGLSAGALFGVSAVGYRGATLQIDGDHVLRAGTALAIATAIQAVLMTVYLAVRNRQEIVNVIQAWRITTLVGVTSTMGSFCWFVAFALQNAAYVKALGQVEVVLSITIGALVFKERLTIREFLGVALITLSVVLILISA